MATKLGREFCEWDEMYAGLSESTLTERRLASWRLMRKRETRIAVRLWDYDIVGRCSECCAEEYREKERWRTAW